VKTLKSLSHPINYRF